MRKIDRYVEKRCGSWLITGTGCKKDWLERMVKIKMVFKKSNGLEKNN